MSARIRWRLLLLALLMEGFVLVVALVAARIVDVALLPLSRHVVRDLVMGTIAAAVPFGFMVFSLSEQARSVPILRSVRATSLQQIRPLFLSAGLPDIVLISGLAGLAEELLFRGVIQTKLGIVVASVAFGVVHFVSFPYVVVVTAIGLFVGAVYKATGSLLVVIQLHAFYDCAALVYLKYFAGNSANALEQSE